MYSLVHIQIHTIYIYFGHVFDSFLRSSYSIFIKLAIERYTHSMCLYTYIHTSHRLLRLFLPYCHHNQYHNYTHHYHQECSTNAHCYICYGSFTLNRIWPTNICNNIYIFSYEFILNSNNTTNLVPEVF